MFFTLQKYVHIKKLPYQNQIGEGALEPTKNLKWGNEKPHKYNAIIKIKCFDGSQLENLLLTVLKQMCWVQL
ncbi:hypothetical protein ACSQ67_004387 [Phaseolus vulgaris]